MIKKNLKYIISLFVVFIICIILVLLGTVNKKKDIGSMLINKNFPVVKDVEALKDFNKFTRDDLKGKVSVVNIFASWCFGCFQEHANILELSNKYNVYGVLFKDTTRDATDYLNNYGNPYTGIINDENGRVSVNLGVEAVPETFIIDKKGKIRFKFSGYIRKKDLKNTIIPIIEYLNKK